VKEDRTMTVSRRRLPLVALAGLALAMLVAAGVTALALASGRTKSPPEVRSVRTEIALAAGRALWEPGKQGRGTLTLDDIDPRMVVMTVAPRRRGVVVPASMLAGNWKPLFAANANETNIVLAVDLDGRRGLVPLRARLLDGHPSGQRLRLAVFPLRQGAHTLDSLGRSRATYDGVTVLVDPSVTDQIKAMWEALVAFFAGKTYELPPNPTYSDNGQTWFVDGFDPENEKAATYKGPTSGEITTADERSKVQQDVVDAVGNISQRVFGNDLRGWNLFAGGTYDGLALFDDTPGVFIDGASDDRTAVTNSAIYEMDLSQFEIKNADIGALNLRGTTADELTIEHSAFDMVDITGATLGSEASRSSVTNTVIENMSGNEASRSSFKGDGLDGVSPWFENVDFTSVSFVNGKLQKAKIDGTTFQGCGLSGVDLTGAEINGADAKPGGSFQPTFDNSIFENVKFDGATLYDVSFRGADFSSGHVTFTGAKLANVDFTGATGLQYIDWENVEIAGDVYGLETVASRLNVPRASGYLRTFTIDVSKPGEDPDFRIPEIDDDTRFDIDPRNDLLIDPASGVRFARNSFDGTLVPVSPETGEQLTALNGDKLVYDGGRLVDPEDPDVDYRVDYETGELVYR
jgi:uncharacterized protein YjbI with pentapeptide repeats